MSDIAGAFDALAMLWAIVKWGGAALSGFVVLFLFWWFVRKR